MFAWPCWRGWPDSVIVLGMTDVTNVISVVVAGAAAVISGLAWRSSEKSRKAGEREATAAESANDYAKRANALAKEANEIARESRLESRAALQLQEAQFHQQSRPDVTMSFGEIPDGQGWLPVRLWTPVAFESATITLPREFVPKPFAGLGPGPDEPNRHDFGLTIDLPATEAGTTVTRGLWVYQPVELSERTVRLMYEIRLADHAPWSYTFEHTFPQGPGQIW
jgi:hypothetical protein